jgi:hypothetical protein
MNGAAAVFDSRITIGSVHHFVVGDEREELAEQILLTLLREGDKTTGQASRADRISRLARQRRQTTTEPAELCAEPVNNGARLRVVGKVDRLGVVHQVVKLLAPPAVADDVDSVWRSE